MLPTILELHARHFSRNASLNLTITFTTDTLFVYQFLPLTFVSGGNKILNGNLLVATTRHSCGEMCILHQVADIKSCAIKSAGLT